MEAPHVGNSLCGSHGQEQRMNRYSYNRRLYNTLLAGRYDAPDPKKYNCTSTLDLFHLYPIVQSEVRECLRAAQVKECDERRWWVHRQLARDVRCAAGIAHFHPVLLRAAEQR